REVARLRERSAGRTPYRIDQDGRVRCSAAEPHRRPAAGPLDHLGWNPARGDADRDPFPDADVVSYVDGPLRGLDARDTADDVRARVVPIFEDGEEEAALWRAPPRLAEPIERTLPAHPLDVTPAHLGHAFERDERANR